MVKVSVALAKLAGIRKAVEATLDDEHARRGKLPYQHFKVDEVRHYFSGAQNQLSLLREELPDLYADFIDLPTIPATEMSKASEHAEAEWRYSRAAQ